FFGISRHRRGFVSEGASLLPAGLQLSDVSIAGALGHPGRNIELIEDREQAPGVDADFLEHDGDIPSRLEAGGGWFRGWRLGVCRGGAEEDNQPHCFNLSRGMGGGRRTRESVPWGKPWDRQPVSGKLRRKLGVSP